MVIPGSNPATANCTEGVALGISCLASTSTVVLLSMVLTILRWYFLYGCSSALSAGRLYQNGSFSCQLIGIIFHLTASYLEHFEGRISRELEACLLGFFVCGVWLEVATLSENVASMLLLRRYDGVGQLRKAKIVGVFGCCFSLVLGTAVSGTPSSGRMAYTRAVTIGVLAAGLLGHFVHSAAVWFDLANSREESVERRGDVAILRRSWSYLAHRSARIHPAPYEASNNEETVNADCPPPLVVRDCVAVDSLVADGDGRLNKAYVGKDDVPSANLLHPSANLGSGNLSLRSVAWPEKDQVTVENSSVYTKSTSISLVTRTSLVNRRHSAFSEQQEHRSAVHRYSCDRRFSWEGPCHDAIPQSLSCAADVLSDSPLPGDPDRDRQQTTPTPDGAKSQHQRNSLSVERPKCKCSSLNDIYMDIPSPTRRSPTCSVGRAGFLGVDQMTSDRFDALFSCRARTVDVAVSSVSGPNPLIDFSLPGVTDASDVSQLNVPRVRQSVDPTSTRGCHPLHVESDADGPRRSVADKTSSLLGSSHAPGQLPLENTTSRAPRHSLMSLASISTLYNSVEQKTSTEDAHHHGQRTSTVERRRSSDMTTIFQMLREGYADELADVTADDDPSPNDVGRNPSTSSTVSNVDRMQEDVDLTPACGVTLLESARRRVDTWPKILMPTLLYLVRYALLAAGAICRLTGRDAWACSVGLWSSLLWAAGLLLQIGLYSWTDMQMRLVLRRLCK